MFENRKLAQGGKQILLNFELSALSFEQAFMPPTAKRLPRFALRISNY